MRPTDFKSIAMTPSDEVVLLVIRGRCARCKLHRVERRMVAFFLDKSRHLRFCKERGATFVRKQGFFKEDTNNLTFRSYPADLLARC